MKLLRFSAAEVLDGLRDVFPKSIVNVLTYIVSMTENIIRITHHVAIIHEEIGERLYNVSFKHQKVVTEILTMMNPETYRTLIRSLSRLNFTEVSSDIFSKSKFRLTQS